MTIEKLHSVNGLNIQIVIPYPNIFFLQPMDHLKSHLKNNPTFSLIVKGL